jgi:hypothetical protein
VVHCFPYLSSVYTVNFLNSDPFVHLYIRPGACLAHSVRGCKSDLSAQVWAGDMAQAVGHLYSLFCGQVGP